MRIATIVLVLLAALPAAADDTALSRATLKSIRGVLLVVGHIDEEQRRAGFHEQAFRTAAELKLRMVGIKVLTERA